VRKETLLISVRQRTELYIVIDDARFLRGASLHRQF
jgi:hypothetical protein